MIAALAGIAGLAVRAFVDGLAAAARRAVRVRWSLPDAEHRRLAAATCGLVGLRATTS